MTADEFNVLVEQFFDRIRNTLLSKGQEYADDNNRFRNFMHVAASRRTTQADALMGLVQKQIVSLEDMAQGLLPVTRYLVDEKIGDVVNYMLLLYGIWSEQLNKEEKIN